MTTSDVTTHKIKGRSTGPQLLILAGVHGDEYEPMAAVNKLSQVIDAGLLSGSVTLVPVLNRPAYDRLSRTGSDELDLARTFPGDPAGSVTQQIASKANALIESVDYLIDLHTGGLAFEISPLTGYMLHTDSKTLDIQRRMARAMNLPIVWGTSNKLDGRSLSAARDANVPAIYAEWGGGGGCNRQGVDDYVTGCLSVMAELGMYEFPPSKSRVEITIEDPRDQSGHLQLNNPAPHAGFFEPSVRLNERITAGSVIGLLHGEFHRPATEIRATQTGILILLRALPPVNAGESLAVILETE